MGVCTSSLPLEALSHQAALLRCAWQGNMQLPDHPRPEIADQKHPPLVSSCQVCKERAMFTGQKGRGIDLEVDSEPFNQPSSELMLVWAAQICL